MWNTLYYKCFWGHVCHILVYSRGRIAGGQDLVGQHSALPFRHTGHCSGHLLDGRVLENCHNDVKQQKLHTYKFELYKYWYSRGKHTAIKGQSCYENGL